MPKPGQVPEFDPGRPFAEIRGIDVAQTLAQDGHIFSLRHEYLRPDPNWKEPEPEPTFVAAETRPPELPPDDGRAGVLARAQNKLKGYAEPQDLSETKKENTRARAAERLAV